MNNHLLSKEKKQKSINTNTIIKYNVVVISRDQQLWRSSFSLIQIRLLFFSIKLDDKMPLELF